MSKLIPRAYQQLAVDSVEVGKVNLLVLPQRAGKTLVFKLMIEQFEPKKALLIIGYRHIAEQIATYFEDVTFIMAGKSFDNSKQVHVASFQTMQSRLEEIDLSQYDLIIQDERHSRMSKQVDNIVLQKDTTVVFATGTPLTQSNKLITKGIDNHINPITVTEMMQQRYLAPTKFMSNKNVIGENASQLRTNRGDYSEADVKQVVQKSDLLKDIVRLVEKEDLATKHKTLVYVNFISTAQELYEMLKDSYDNVFVLHSKLSNKQQTELLNSYQTCENGLIISVRSLSLGFDSPTSNRLVFGLLTKIHSLALQILWRSSTKNPADPNKQAIVYDMLGILSEVNAYTDFSEYSKKLSCKDECSKLPDLFDRYACLESCAGEPPMSNCDGKLSYDLQENPHVSNYTVHSGIPCKESVPIHNMSYKTTDAGEGRLQKWSMCPCGLITSYILKTSVVPSEMIEVYSDLNPNKNCITVLYDPSVKKAIALFDSTERTRYKVLEFNNSEEMFKSAVKFFKNQTFTILSTTKLSKLPNVVVDTELKAVLPLVNWESGNHDGLVKKLIILKLEHILEFLQMKKGYAYYQKKHINKDNEKQVMTFLNGESLTKQKVVKFFDKLGKFEAVQECMYCKDPNGSYSTTIVKKAIKPKTFSHRWTDIGYCCDTCERNGKQIIFEYSNQDE